MRTIFLFMLQSLDVVFMGDFPPQILICNKIQFQIQFQWLTIGDMYPVLSIYPIMNKFHDNSKITFQLRFAIICFFNNNN